MSTEQHTAATWRADQRLPERDEASLGLAGAEQIRALLTTARTVAIVGLSADQMRPSYFVAVYLQAAGYRIFPVNPRYAGSAILGRPVVSSLAEIPEHLDIVDIFRKPADVPAVVDDAVAIGAGAVWMQLGVISAEARRAGAGRGPRGGDGSLHESGARPSSWQDAHHGLRDRHHLGPPPHSRGLDGRARSASAHQS